MIQVYNANNTGFEKNGDMTLLPTVASIHVVLNGAWEGTIRHPIDAEGRWKYITEESVVKMPSFNGEQLFRIKRRIKSDTEIVATLEPVFLDAMDDCFIVDTRPTNKDGQQALNMILAPNGKYSGESNITKLSTAYYELKNAVEAINGEDDNSFIKRWGGEVIFDNHKVIINERVGGDYGVELRYGKNIPADGLSEDVDMREMVTRIYPKSYNGYMMTGKGHADSPLIEHYPTVRAATITFEDVKMRDDAQDDDEEKGTIICDSQAQMNAALAEKCKEQFELGIDKPVVTITAKMALLQNTELYEDYQVLEKVLLGDTIHCKHKYLAIVTDARVIELEYDSITKKVTDTVIGEFQYNYFNNVSSAVNRVEAAIREDGSIIAEQVKGIINAMNASLQLQSTVAKKVDGRAFLIEDLDPKSGMFGAMEAGTQGLRISKRRSADNRSWQWATAITALGIIADAIVTGSITSRNWVENSAGFRLNLDEGTINSKNLKLDTDGMLRVYKALIAGGELTLGGADGADGIIYIKDDVGNEIGRWDKNGLDVKSGRIKGVGITIGGNNNQSGEMAVLDESGNEVIKLNKDGIYSEGKYISGSNQSGRKVEVSEGEYKILDSDGKTVARIFAPSNNWARMECGKSSIALTENSISLNADNIGPGGSYGKTGTAEFSDGTYLTFRDGFLIGGYTKEGGNI